MLGTMTVTTFKSVMDRLNTANLGQGLRPKSGGLKVRSGKPFQGGHSVPRAGNPLDQLCCQLLNWNIMEYVSKSSTSSNRDRQMELIPNCEVKMLPDVYESYEQYVEAWEPLMVKEIQESVASKLLSKIEASTNSGVFHCSQAEAATDAESSELVQLDCNFYVSQAFDDVPNIKKDSTW